MSIDEATPEQWDKTSKNKTAYGKLYHPEDKTFTTGRGKLNKRANKNSALKAVILFSVRVAMPFLSVILGTIPCISQILTVSCPMSIES